MLTIRAMTAAASMGEALHERESELAALSRALDDAVAGTGRVALVEGTPGIGKTRLLDEVCRLADGTARVLRARGGEQERDVPLLVTRELFTPYVLSAPADELDRAFAGAASLAGPLLGRGTADAATADPGFALIHGLYWLIANLADEAPLVLAVDDVHWVDDATQHWIAYLLPRIAELPVLLVLAARPRELAPDGPLSIGLGGAEVVQVRPGALTAAGSRQLLERLLPTPSDRFLDAAHRSTGGNPLLLRNLAHEVRDRGLDADDDVAGRLDQIGAVGLARIVRPRLHRRGTDALALARAVAVLGDGCSLVDAAGVAGLGAEAAAAAYDALVADEVMLAAAPAFTHPLVRAVVVEDLPPGTKRALHARAARVLREHGADAEEVGRHLAATEPTREEWAVPVLLEAAALATARGAPEAALRHLVTALREDLDPATRCAVLLDAGWQAFRCGDARGRAWLEEALATAPDDTTAVFAWMAVWNWRLVLLDGHDPATVRVGVPQRLEGDLRYAVGGHAMLDMGFTGANLRFDPELNLRLAAPDGDTLFERLYLCALAMNEVLTCGSAERAVEHAERAWQDGLLLREAADLAIVLWGTLSLGAAGQLGREVAVARAAMENGGRRGSPGPVEWNVILTGAAEVLRGHIAAAEATVLTWLEQFGEPRHAVGRPSFAAVVLDIHRERGRLDEADELLGRPWLHDAIRHDFGSAFLLDRRGRLHLAAGRPAEALDDFRACGDLLDAFGARSCAFPAWRPGAAAALVALGRVDEARELAEEQLVDARRFGAAPLLGTSLRTLAVSVGGAEGVALAEEAVAVLARSEARLEHGWALVDLGRLVRLDQRPTAARKPLQEALEIADRCGAALLAQEAEQELRLCGARPRRRAVTGVHALTPAELRVATLAAQGRSNPEIAQSLFVTRKTVEKHLGSAFAKLHISSRDQLSQALDTDHQEPR